MRFANPRIARGSSRGLARRCRGAGSGPDGLGLADLQHRRPMNGSANDGEGRSARRTTGIDAEYVVVPANVLNQRLAAAFEAHTPPDAFMQGSGAIQFYIARGSDGAAGRRARRNAQGSRRDLREPVSAGAWQGTIQALPLEVDVTPMFARKDLLDEIGKPLPADLGGVARRWQAIQTKHPQISGFGMTVSNSNDAESAIRMMIWSFGGKVMAEDGKTVVFNSPETRAAYQFVADMFLKDRIIPHSALTWDDAGNNVAYQTGRAAFVMNPPSIYQWLQEHDKKLLAATVMVSVPKGPGPKGMERQRGGQAGSGRCRRIPSTRIRRRQWLNYFYDPAHYKAGDRRSRRPLGAGLSGDGEAMKLFADNPAMKSVSGSWRGPASSMAMPARRTRSPARCGMRTS